MTSLWETQGLGGLVVGRQRDGCQRQLDSRFACFFLAEERGLLRRHTVRVRTRVWDEAVLQQFHLYRGLQ